MWRSELGLVLVFVWLRDHLDSVVVTADGAAIALWKVAVAPAAPHDPEHNLQATTLPPHELDVMPVEVVDEDGNRIEV